MKKGYSGVASALATTSADTSSKSTAKKGYQNVNVVNTPTVRIKNDPYPVEKPTLHLDEKDLSDIKDLKIGQTIKVEIEAEVTSLSNDMYSDGKKGMHACFKINSVMLEDGKSDTD